RRASFIPRSGAYRELSEIAEQAPELGARNGCDSGNLTAGIGAITAGVAQCAGLRVDVGLISQNRYAHSGPLVETAIVAMLAGRMVFDHIANCDWMRSACFVCTDRSGSGVDCVGRLTSNDGCNRILDSPPARCLADSRSVTYWNVGRPNDWAAAVA